jgi:hypothetical protein
MKEDDRAGELAGLPLNLGDSLISKRTEVQFLPLEEHEFVYCRQLLYF